MKPSLYFFGDSWTAEQGELELWHKTKNITPTETLQSYPAIVANCLGLPYKNFGLRGSSQFDMVHQFLNSDIQPGDHAVFALTASARRFFYSENKKNNSIGIDTNKAAVNSYQDSWLSGLTCFTLCQLAREKQVSVWFFAAFDRIWEEFDYHPIWDSVPDSVWLIPKNQSALAEFDPEFFSIPTRSELYTWLRSGRDSVEQYIRPCDDHPNMNGRKKIANIVALALESRL